jgi:hypothetical protein
MMQGSILKNKECIIVTLVHDDDLLTVGYSVFVLGMIVQEVVFVLNLYILHCLLGYQLQFLVMKLVVSCPRLTFFTDWGTEGVFVNEKFIFWTYKQRQRDSQ